MVYDQNKNNRVNGQQAEDEMEANSASFHSDNSQTEVW